MAWPSQAVGIDGSSSDQVMQCITLQKHFTSTLPDSVVGCIWSEVVNHIEEGQVRQLVDAGGGFSSSCRMPIRVGEL